MMEKVRYAAREIARNGGDPAWWRLRFTSRVAGPALGAIHGNDGIDFMAEDWDNLLILDACRADMFEEAVDTTRFDEYRRVHSPGCASAEWMRETFDGAEYPDTVYVTANPWISKLAPDTFHDIVNLWIERGELSSDEIRDADGIAGVGSSRGRTIHPDTLSDAAREAHERYPDKRLIVHYFQPHAPVVGNPDGTRKDPDEHGGLHPVDDLKPGRVTRQEVWDGFVDNLLYAMHYAEELAADLGGRSVFTADHGELFGERLWPFPVREYAHVEGVRHPKLTEVPWAVVDHGERRESVAGETTHHEADDDVIDDRLRDLGYKV